MDNIVQKKKMKFWKKTLITVIIIILVLAVLLGITVVVMWSMATNTDNKSKITQEASLDIAEPMLQSVIFGKEQQITDKQINGAISYVIELAEEVNEDKQDDDKSMEIKGANIYLHQNDNEIYILLDYRGTELVVKADVDISLNSDKKEISLTLDDCYVGTLPIDPKLLLSVLEEREAFSSVYDKIIIKENTVVLPSSYTFNIMDYEFPIEITKLHTGENSAEIQTTSALETLTGIFGKYILSLLE